jgi:PAS domain S-box-containing protein
MKKTREPQATTNHRSREVAALLEAAHAVHEKRVFGEAAGAILGACKSLLAAEAGFVAVRPSSGGAFEVAVADPAGGELETRRGLPARLEQLVVHVCAAGAGFDNDLDGRTAGPRARAGHPVASNALLASIVLGDEIAGLLGFLDKLGGFSSSDLRLAEVFAEMTAVAMLERRALNGLERARSALAGELRASTGRRKQAEESFQALVENLPDVVARYDSDLRLVYVSAAAERLTGRPARELVGRSNLELGISAEVVAAYDAALRRVFSSGRPESFESAVATRDGTRHFETRLVPESGSEEGVSSVLSVARDVTDRWHAHEAERRARSVADALREATVALTRSFDRETVLTTLLDRLRPIVPFDRGSVMLLEEALRVSVRAVFDGARVVPLAPEARAQFDGNEHPVVRDILTSGTPVLIPDIREVPDWSLPADRASEASWMGVPLFTRGTVAGLFALSKREPGYFNQDHVRLAEAMSSQASVAVENAVLFEQMQASASRMRSLSRRLVEVQESERRQIARELHDEAGQALASLRYGLRLLEREVDLGGDVTARVAELLQRTDSVIEGLQRLAAHLRPASLDHLGLEAALRQYAQSAAAEFGLAVHFKARGFTGERLPAAVETALYRIVQEAVTNVVRHSRARQVDVLAERRGDRVRVMIEDDGVGFAPGQVDRGSHFGLLGMKERVEALDGSLLVESSPSSGTTIVAEVSSADPNPDR